MQAGILLAILLGVLIAALGYRRRLYRLFKSITLFSPGVIVENFRSMHRIFPTKRVKKSPQPFTFEYGDFQLPAEFHYKGETLNTRQFIEDTGTTGLLVLHKDRIVFEEYRLGQTPQTTSISWSVGKSFVSALFGIALHEGYIDSIEQAVTDYVPELKGSGYDGVRIKDVLQMSSGVKFNEDYADFHADINRFGRHLALGASLDRFSASLVRENPPGKFHHYVSIDTQVLGMILARATGTTLSDYLETRLWQKIGTEADALWITDDKGMELALGGLNITLRDYARLGRLYLNEGNWNGEQIIPVQWVRDSIAPDAPHLQPGLNPLSTNLMGYGYQWWIPETPRGDFLAIGIYNQFIYVNPGSALVVVKTSANYHYKEDTNTSEYQSVALFQAIAEKLAPPAGDIPPPRQTTIAASNAVSKP